MSNQISNIAQRVINAEQRGAPIFSFTYNGRKRNVQIGSNKARDISNIPWANSNYAKVRSKSVLSYCGSDYVVGIDQNDHYRIKCFDTSKMEDVQGI